MFVAEKEPWSGDSLPRETTTVTDVLAGRAFATAGSRCLKVAHRVVATLRPDAAEIVPLTAVSGEGMPVVEVLAAVAASHPSGLLILESTRGEDDAAAFYVEKGGVTGASAGGPLGRMESWVAEAHRRFPERFGEASSGWEAEGRNFVREQLFAALERSRAPGSRMVFLRGGVAWHGPTLPSDRASSLQMCVLEDARRHDEMPAIARALGDLQRVVRQLLAPPTRPPTVKAAAEDEWGGPEEVDEAEWADVRCLWTLIDEQHTVDELLDAALMGRFRAARALATLLSGAYVRLEAAPPRPAPNISSLPSRPHDVETPAPTQPVADVIPLPTPARLLPQRPRESTEYSIVCRFPAAERLGSVGTRSRSSVGRVRRMPPRSVDADTVRVSVQRPAMELVKSPANDAPRREQAGRGDTGGDAEVEIDIELDLEGDALPTAAPKTSVHGATRKDVPRETIDRVHGESSQRSSFRVTLLVVLGCIALLALASVAWLP